MKFDKKQAIIGSVVAVAVLMTARIHAQSANPIFTAAQAEQGKTAYERSCAGCHGQNLEDGEFAPPVRGASFIQQWGRKPVEGLFTYISTKMPPSNRGGLSTDAYTEILAYLLSANGVQAGNQALPSDAAALKPMIMPGPPPGRGGPGGGLSPYATLPAAPSKPNPLDKITPVTEAMLRNPPVSDWLTWRRTWDDQGFSPLKQINKANVADLHVAWTWSLPAGPNESTPLVHDGVIFVHSYGDNVQALDARNGDLLWQYTHKLPKEVTTSVKRNIAIYGDRLLVATSDLHMVSLDVKTGTVMWDHEIAPHDDRRLRLTGGPLVAKGKVMVGTVGNIPGGNFIVALDTETGKEAWRFWAIARPGETGGGTWNGLPLEKRNGASVWTAGSYDPDLNLVYFGPAQTYDTGPLLHPVNQPGITNDGLYTDTTVAINPDTGKVKWFFQHTPNDQWDLDWAFERQLIDVPVNGVNRKLVVTSGKEALYDALDRATGQYAFSMDLGLQNVVTDIDPKTGAKKINPKVIPGNGETVTVCPHAGGAKSWLPASWNSETKILYVPLVESCMDLIPVAPGGRGGLTSGVRFSIRPPLETDGKFGRLEAINLATRKVLWTDRQRAPTTAGALATAGGVVFSGSLDRVVKAYDAANGKTLWQTRLNDVPSSAPMTYSVDGRQYVAMVVGNGGAQTATWPVLVPEIQNPPNGGAAIWVFELPDKDVAGAKGSR
ncbi:MAG TPA: PQQ-binding-like beta-propeller repeat protein [Bryobacteraceae bacterium]|jgi:alcohol dehydrogenase (cytochrome c)